MTIDMLIEALNDAREDMGGATEIRIAYQPSWPLRGTIARVTVPEPESYYEGERAVGQGKDESMLWLAVGSAPYDENPYGPRWAWGY